MNAASIKFTGILREIDINQLTKMHQISALKKIDNFKKHQYNWRDCLKNI